MDFISFIYFFIINVKRVKYDLINPFDEKAGNKKVKQSIDKNQEKAFDKGKLLI